MSQPYRIALAGLGTVGVGVAKILKSHSDAIARKAGRPIEVVAVSARDKSRSRDFDFSDVQWFEDAVALANEDVDCIVEMIGGESGVAKDLAEAALSKGIDFVTANKALLAHHGYDLAKTAEGNNAGLMYEAAVAGGIPIIKAIREGYAANDISAVYGILNGTCNYILTEMRKTGRDFKSVLADAQKLGYAEADPAFDIEGTDAAHKLCLLTALAFKVKPDFKKLSVKGITNVTSVDIEFARELGYRIKLLGMARKDVNNIVQSVEPCMVPRKSTMGAVDGVYNAVYIEGDFVDTGLLVGRGAGEGPTASAVVADIIDLARGVKQPVFGVPYSELVDANWGRRGKVESQFYLHLRVMDKPGVLADVSAILRDCDVSIEAMLQRGRDPNNPVSIVMTTHEVQQKHIEEALEGFANLECVLEKPSMMRIEDF